jgi:hypothetical protein
VSGPYRFRNVRPRRRGTDRSDDTSNTENKRTRPVQVVAKLSVKPKISGTLFSRAFIDLCLIDDVAYMRDAMRAWNDWSAENDQLTPLFNWNSVFNFNSVPDFSVFALDQNGLAQAFMLIRSGHVVRCDNGHRRPLVYVNFLEVAPWNKPTAPHRAFQGLGPILLRIACDISIQRGYNGRVGLHSVAEAEDFYRRIGFQVFDCPSEYNELYMELSGPEARKLLSD